MFRNLNVKTIEESKVLLLGVASDKNASIDKGARFAPKVLRKLSECLPSITKDGNEIKPLIYDFGDIKGYKFEKIYEKALKMVQKPQFCLFFGGDHSISIPTQKAFLDFYKDKKVGVIHFDAHADICNFYDGSKFSHACPNRRNLENGLKSENLTMVGIRSFEKQEVNFLTQHPEILCLTAKTLDEIGTDKAIEMIVEKYKNFDCVYLSFDIDITDPAYAPGTGTPEAFGVLPKNVLKMILSLIKELPIKCMDIVEIAPTLDVNNITSWLALKILLEVLYLIDGVSFRLLA